MQEVQGSKHGGVALWLPEVDPPPPLLLSLPHLVVCFVVVWGAGGRGKPGVDWGVRCVLRCGVWGVRQERMKILTAMLWCAMLCALYAVRRRSV